MLSLQELSTLTTGTLPLNITFYVTEMNGEAIYDRAFKLSSSYDMLYVSKDSKGDDSSRRVRHRKLQGHIILYKFPGKGSFAVYNGCINTRM